MTREEAKELLPIIQAFAEGKTIQFRERDIEEPSFDGCINEYRIKPKQVRPYTLKELVEAIKIHGPIIKAHEESYEDGYYTIVFFSGEDIGIIDAYNDEIKYYSYNEYTSETWSWADDGSPIGVIEEY